MAHFIKYKYWTLTKFSCGCVLVFVHWHWPVSVIYVSFHFILWWALANPSWSRSAWAVAEITKRNPQILGSSPSPGPCSHLLDGFYDGSWQILQLYAKFEVVGFIYDRNIREFVFKNGDKLKWETIYWRNWFYHRIRRPNLSYLIYNLWSYDCRKWWFYDELHFTVKYFKFGGLGSRIENFWTKVPKGTPLRQIWSNKSFGVGPACH